MRYRINYNNVISQARDISGYAVRLSEQADAIANLEQECSKVWRGDAASAFISKLQTLSGELEKTSRQIETLAETIRSCANRIQREDELAAKRAAAMSNGSGGGFSIGGGNGGGGGGMYGR